jgi:hypothetical protein
MAGDFLTINPAQARRFAEKSSTAYVNRLTERVAVNARLLAPGTMKEKIRVIPAGGINPIGIIVCDHPATIFVIDGTKPHDIRPKPGGVLVFVPKGGGNKVFTRLVHHPGTRANNFLMKALRSV